MLPWTFAVKVAVAVVILIIAMALAFARMGADRLTLEQYLKRQLVFRFQPRKYSYFQKEKTPARGAPAAVSRNSRPFVLLSVLSRLISPKKDCIG